MLVHGESVDPCLAIWLCGAHADYRRKHTVSCQTPMITSLHRPKHMYQGAAIALFSKTRPVVLSSELATFPLIPMLTESFVRYHPIAKGMP